MSVTVMETDSERRSSANATACLSPSAGAEAPPGATVGTSAGSDAADTGAEGDDRKARGAGMTAMIAMVARASGQAAVVLVTLVATRALSPADFGVFAIGAALLTLARTMLYTGPFEYLLKAPLDRTRVVSSACLAANGVVALGWLALLGLIGFVSPYVFQGAGVGTLLFALAPSNLVAALAGWLESLMLRSGQVRRYYGVTIAVEVLSAAGAAALLLGGFGLWALVAQVYLRLLLLVAFYSALLPRQPLGWPDRAETGAVLRWSLSRYGSVIVSFLSNYSGDLLLGMAFSPAASGLYRVGNRIVTALADMFNQPAALLMTTALAAANARGERDTKAWVRLALPFAAMAWPALTVLALLADGVAPVVLGPAWAAAGPVVAVFCVARMASLVGTAAMAELIVGDRQGRILAIQSAAALASGGLTLLVVHWGALAAALATATVAICAALALARAAADGRQRPGKGAWPLVRQVVVPLAGALIAALAARTMLGATAQGLHTLPHLVLAAVCAAAGWALGVMLVLPGLRSSLAILASGRRAGG